MSGGRGRPRRDGPDRARREVGTAAPGAAPAGTPPDGSSTAGRAAFVHALVRWLNERVAPPGVRVGPDTALFEDGLIDSMRILELIAWTERETGRTIPDELVLMEHFRTPRRIAEVFVEGGGAAAGAGAGEDAVGTPAPGGRIATGPARAPGRRSPPSNDAGAEG